MPKECTAIQIFVGSPSDVRSERDRIEAVIAELNVHLVLTSNLFFHVIKYETHVYPDIADDPQDVINKQIPQDYDIFLGIMWKRLGTRTPRASSGTVEEFERAYAKLKAKAGVTIMFYFKTEGVNPQEIDPEQLESLLAFKNWLSGGGAGALIKEFSDTGDFDVKLRTSLRLYADRFLSSRESTNIDRVTDEIGSGSRVNVKELNELTTLAGRLQGLVQDFGHNLGQAIREFAAISQEQIGRNAVIDTPSSAIGRIKDRFLERSTAITRRMGRDLQAMVQLAAKGNLSTRRAVAEAIMEVEEDLKSIREIVDRFEQRVAYEANDQITDLSDCMRESVARLLSAIATIREDSRAL
jgi:hypothetical protein